MPDLRVNDLLTIPESAIEARAVRASGPGGQNVNKLATKIQMRVDLDRIPALGGEDLARVRDFLKSRLDAEGKLLVMSQETRDQSRNREDCARKVVELIRAALFRPKARRRTRPTFASKQRRVEAKRHQADRRRDRRIED